VSLMASHICADSNDPRLLGQRMVGGCQQLQQKLRLEEPQAVGMLLKLAVFGLLRVSCANRRMLKSSPKFLHASEGFAFAKWAVEGLLALLLCGRSWQQRGAKLARARRQRPVPANLPNPLPYK